MRKRGKNVLRYQERCCVLMKVKIKQFICGLFNHKFNSMDTDCKWNEKEGTYTITEICCRCGKQFSFTAPAKNFGLRIK